MSNLTRIRRLRLSLLLPAALSLALVAGCNALRFATVTPNHIEKPPAPQPAKKSEFRVSQFVFLHDFEINRNLPIFHELAELREQVYKELQIPPSNTPVYVHLFENQQRYEQFMKATYPELPRRRAYFVAQARAIGGSEDLLVYTYWGDRINQDLRHELTHALLHSVLKDVPLWLDEGLAEYFEMPSGWQGVNYQHLAHLCRGPGGPCKSDMARLEGLTSVAQMTPAEYRESWAWVHLILHGSPEAKKVLVGYLRELRTNPRPGPLRPRLLAVLAAPDEALTRHLARLDRIAPPASTAQR